MKRLNFWSHTRPLVVTDLACYGSVFIAVVFPERCFVTLRESQRDVVCHHDRHTIPYHASNRHAIPKFSLSAGVLKRGMWSLNWWKLGYQREHGLLHHRVIASLKSDQLIPE